MSAVTKNNVMRLLEILFKRKHKQDVDLTNESSNKKQQSFDELCNLVNLHIINKKEVYNIAQFISVYYEILEIKGILSSICSTDVIEKLIRIFPNKLKFLTSSRGSKT